MGSIIESPPAPGAGVTTHDAKLVAGFILRSRPLLTLGLALAALGHRRTRSFCRRLMENLCPNCQRERFLRPGRLRPRLWKEGWLARCRKVRSLPARLAHEPYCRLLPVRHSISLGIEAQRKRS